MANLKGRVQTETGRRCAIGQHAQRGFCGGILTPVLWPRGSAPYASLLRAAADHSV